MEKVRCGLAYVLGLIGWFAGVVIGVIWNLLYGLYQETDFIDITVVLAENILPAIISVYLADYIFTKIFPDVVTKKINTIIFYVILFLNYGYILCSTFLTANYTNIIYVLTGVIYLIILISKLLKENEEKQIIK